MRPDTRVSVSVQELAEATGIPERTLHHYIAKGALRAHRVGPRRLYIHVDDAESFLGYPLSRNSRNADNNPLPSSAVGCVA